MNCCTMLRCLTIALVRSLLCRSVLPARLAALARGVGVEGGTPFHHITPQPAGEYKAQKTLL
jgi:hypothetical protein